MEERSKEKVKAGAKAQKEARDRSDPVTEQLNMFFGLPIVLSWSDGHTSESTLGTAFTSEEDYRRYRKYKDSGKPYPLEAAPTELTDEEKAQPSTIFPDSSRDEEQDLLRKICESFTENLQKYLTEPEAKPPKRPITAWGAINYMSQD